jgi:hypothetical protein
VQIVRTPKSTAPSVSPCRTAFTDANAGVCADPGQIMVLWEVSPRKSARFR